MFEAVILGIVQGVSEFLPISSSGHLILIPAILGWDASGLAYDVALNTGTFVAVLIYFFPTWRNLIIQGVFQGQKHERNLIYSLIIATIPAALAGYLIEPILDHTFRQPLIAALNLVVFGLVLWFAEKRARLEKSIDNLTWKDALYIGLGQVLALLPGVSRSGITISTGLASRLTKDSAATFSFLLLAPISLGAAIVEADTVINATNSAQMLVGAIVAFGVGLMSIHLLLTFIKKYGFGPYIWYRIITGSLLLIWLLFR